MNKKSVPNELFRICVEATFGEIYNNVRVISVIYNENKKIFKYIFYIDRNIEEFDIEAAREISSYLADDSRSNKFIEEISEEIIFNLDRYKDLDIMGTTIYKRREYDL